ncbi:TPA: EAL domain-containing protein [Aeromonas hydrophila]|uniref:EAL domain-containing protein n=1 Tax=Aeromonas hydrophila TaxID=644 RepID=UPI001CCBF931|nr:EAL domain-containing protein [Aeromonas hydrophila]UBQ49537.1 EAL domain-containing protein [Aeromonas hydrophila]HDI1214980.1 EAL domain-containing protein [Aeromonas hydrophila]
MKVFFDSIRSLCFFIFILGTISPIIFFDFGTSRIEYYIENHLLDEKRKTLSAFFFKRRLELDESIRALFDKAQFNCGSDDKRLLASLNQYNDAISIYGIVTAQGISCSNVGEVILPVLGNKVKEPTYSINGESINLSEVNEGDSLVRLSKEQGELFWLIRAAKLDSLLNSPCENCFSLNGFFPWAQAGLNLGNRDILSERTLKTIPVLQGPSLMEIVLSVGGNFQTYVKELTLQVVYLALAVHYTIFFGMFVFFVLRKNSLHGKIKSALLNMEFIPYYQPILDVNAHGLVGVEALVRWHKTDGTIVPPAAFIACVEGSDLMLEMTSQLLRKIVKDMDLLAEDIWVSVNICSELLESGTLYDLLEVLDWPYQHRLCFELTERLPISNVDTAQRQIEKLSQKGYHIKIDDFGAGYGGFAYLNDFHIQHIKIDKMFIDSIGRCDRQESIVDGIILSAQRCGLKIIAEGVEHLAQSTYLMNRGVVIQQGYLFYKPMPFDKLLTLCEERAFTSLACDVQLSSRGSYSESV